MDIRPHSSTSNVERFTLKNSTTGAGLTGLSSASSGLIISTLAGNEATATAYVASLLEIETITTLGTYAAPTSDKCRFKEVDATNHPGLYEFQFANARYSVANAKKLIVTVTGATNLLTADYEILLDVAGSFAAPVWDRVLTVATHNIASSAGRRLRTLDNTLDSGTAQAGAASSITLATSASTTLGLYVGCRVYIDGGTGAGQSRYIVGYTTGRVAWVARDWTVTPDGTSTYVVAADDQIPFVHLGLAQAGGGSTITLDSGASATDDIYNGQVIRITAGTGDNQVRIITDYDGTTKVATVAPAWTVNPDATSYFATLQEGPSDVSSINRSANAAARLALSAAVIVPGTVDDTGFAPSTTQFEADDITEATADHYIGAIILWTSGVLLGERCLITDYALTGGRGHFTVSILGGVAMTDAPANNDTFVIV